MSNIALNTKVVRLSDGEQCEVYTKVCGRNVEIKLTSNDQVIGCATFTGNHID